MGNCHGKYTSNRGHRRASYSVSLSSACQILFYFDIDSLIDELPEIRTSLYLASQKLYQENWLDISKALSDASNDISSQELKRLIRRGISDADMHEFISLVFSTNAIEYKSTLAAVFHNQFPKEFLILPTYSEHVLLEKAVSKIYLNEDGKAALKRIMWVVNSKNYSISYCPQLVNIASLLLIYNTEEETFQILNSLILSSNEQKNILDRFLTTNTAEFSSLVGVVIKVLEKKSEELLEFFERKKIALKEFVAKIIMNFGVGYFSFPLLTRLLATYLVEGNKALIKITISMFVLCTSKLITGSAEDFDSFLKASFNSQFSVDLIIAKAFKLKLSKYDLEDLKVSLDLKHPVSLYRPFIEKCLDVLPEKCIYLLWGALPYLYRSYRPVSVYSTQKDGMSLRTLLRKTEKVEEKTPMIIAVLTEHKSVFGLFIDCAIKNSEDYFGENESFLFQHNPEFSVYRSTGKNSHHVCVTNDHISFGAGGQGPALLLDRYLSIGQSYASHTYANPVLDSGYFHIISCEVLALVL